jgi:hypothetical protein
MTSALTIRTRTRFAALAALLIIVAAAAVELAMGRHLICTCRVVDLWIGARDSPKTSQMLADWYSLSHVVHGIIFYVALWITVRRWPVERRFVMALILEATWEVIENTPLVIDRYRQTAAALGYNGDSVVNSVSDMLMMCAGFIAARKLPVRTCVLLVVLLELVPLVVIRDNLALNILNLLVPNHAIEAWQNAR